MLVTNIPDMSRLQQTRERLLVAALELFAERGYDNVSAKEIAARAGVTEMTFFRHFPAKADLVVDDPYDPVIGEAIRRQPSSADPVTRAARAVQAAWRELPVPSVGQVRERLRIVAQTPGLRSSLAGGTAATEAAIVEALTETGTHRREAVAAAGAVVGALNAALLEWSLTDDDDLGQAITSAVAVLEDRRG